MEENTVVAFRNPSNFQDDPLTEVLRAGARELLAEFSGAVEVLKLLVKPWKPSFWKVMRRWLMTGAVAGLYAMATCRNG